MMSMTNPLLYFSLVCHTLLLGALLIKRNPSPFCSLERQISSDGIFIFFADDILIFFLVIRSVLLVLWLKSGNEMRL